MYIWDRVNLKSGSQDDSWAGQHSGYVNTCYVCVNHYCYFVVNLCVRKPVFILFCLYFFFFKWPQMPGKKPREQKMLSARAPWSLFTYHVIYTGPLRELEKMLHRPRMLLPSPIINKHGILHGRAPPPKLPSRVWPLRTAMAFS